MHANKKRGPTPSYRPNPILDRTATLLNDLVSAAVTFTTEPSFSKPCPRHPHTAVLRMVNLLREPRFGTMPRSASRDLYLEGLLDRTFRQGVPFAYMWRWGRYYGAHMLVAALELNLPATEWLAAGKTMNRTPPDESLLLLAGLIMDTTDIPDFK